MRLEKESVGQRERKRYRAKRKYSEETVLKMIRWIMNSVHVQQIIEGKVSREDGMRATPRDVLMLYLNSPVNIPIEIAMASFYDTKKQEEAER